MPDNSEQTARRSGDIGRQSRRTVFRGVAAFGLGISTVTASETRTEPAATEPTSGSTPGLGFGAAVAGLAGAVGVLGRKLRPDTDES